MPDAVDPWSVIDTQPIPQTASQQAGGADADPWSVVDHSPVAVAPPPRRETVSQFADDLTAPNKAAWQELKGDFTRPLSDGTSWLSGDSQDPLSPLWRAGKIGMDAFNYGVVAPIQGVGQAVLGPPVEAATRALSNATGIGHEISREDVGDDVGLIGGMFAGPEGGVLGMARAPVTGAVASKYPEAAARLKDFDRAGITPTLPAVTQDRTLGNIANVTKEVPVLGSPITNAFQQNLAEAQAASARAASGYGADISPEEAGERLGQGVQQFKYGPTGEKDPPPIDLPTALSSPTRSVGVIPKSEALYGAIPIAGGTPATVDSLMAALNRLRTNMQSNPELGAALQDPSFAKFARALEPRTETVPAQTSSFLDAYGNPIVTKPAETAPKGGLSWDDMQNFRTFIGQQMREPSGALGVGRDDWRSLYGAVSQDMKDTAEAAGPDALKAFNRANSYYSAALDRLNNAIGYIDKAGSDEKAFAALQRMGGASPASADAARFAATMKSLPPEFKGDVSAAMINLMGKPAASQAGQGSPFSIGSWVTNYAKMSDAAKDAAFGATGTAQRDDLDTLNRALGSLKNVERLGNPSGSGRYGVVGAAGAQFGAGLFHPAVLAPLAGEGVMAATAAKLLSSPGVARWIANSTKVTTPQGWANQMTRLGTLAAKNPGIVGPYYQAVAGQQQGGQQP